MKNISKIYEIKLIIHNNKSKYKASIDKFGSYCIALCAKSNKEAYEVLQEIVYGHDKRPIKNKNSIFIDDSFKERLDVSTNKKINVFCVNSCECLME